MGDEQIQDYTDNLNMENFDSNDSPDWLKVTKSLEPDWIVRNPKKSPIFEITGFEFSESKVHTATDRNGKGFSIRFPRITKVRDDKKYKDATNILELRELIETSRNNPLEMREKNKNKNKKKNNKKRKKIDDFFGSNDDDQSSPKKKRKINKNKKVNDKEEEEEDLDIKMSNNEDVDGVDSNHNKKNVQPSPSPNGDNVSSPKIMSDDRTICQYDNK